MTTPLDSSTDNSTEEAELLPGQVEASGQEWGQEGCWVICLVVRGESRDGREGAFLFFCFTLSLLVICVFVLQKPAAQLQLPHLH